MLLCTIIFPTYREKKYIYLFANASEAHDVPDITADGERKERGESSSKLEIATGITFKAVAYHDDNS